MTGIDHHLEDLNVRNADQQPAAEPKKTEFGNAEIHVHAWEQTILKRVLAMHAERTFIEPPFRAITLPRFFFDIQV
jgi:hypothetical protein